VKPDLDLHLTSTRITPHSRPTAGDADGRQGVGSDRSNRRPADIRTTSTPVCDGRDCLTFWSTRRCA